MQHNFTASFGRFFLSPLGKDDALKLRTLRNKMRHCFLTQEEISEEQQLLWYQNYMTKECDYMFAVKCADKVDDFIGAIALYNIDSSTAEIGRVIIDKEKCPDKGVGKRAIQAACQLGFFTLQLEMIYAYVLLDNIPSLTAFRRLQFQETDGQNGCIYFTMKKEEFLSFYHDFI